MSVNCVLLYGIQNYSLYKPAGPFRIKTELLKHGYTIQCIDQTVWKGDKIKDLFVILSNIIDEKTLWFGVSTTFLNKFFGYPYVPDELLHLKLNEERVEERLISLLDHVKKLNPNIKFIAGGARRFRLEKFGFKFFKGYADKEIIEYTDYLAGKTKNINLKYFNDVIEGSEFSDFSTSQILYEKNDIIEPEDPLPIEVSRGCIFKCKFCSFPLNGKTKGEWIKQTNVLLDEFNRNYEHFGVTDYIFSDDTYNDSAEKMKIFYDEVFNKLKFKINFTAYLRLDLMMRFPDTVEYLKESGLKSALFGIETLNYENAKIIGKGVDPKIQFQFLKDLKNNHFKNILLYSGFILGLPKDKSEDMEEFEEFLFSDENCLDDIMVEPLHLYPTDIKSYSKIYYSVFELEHEKYGYRCIEKEKNTNREQMQWENINTGMTFKIANYYASRIKDRKFVSTKFKYGGWAYNYYKSLHVKDTDLMTLSRSQINEKYNLTDLYNQKKDRYVKKLFEISKSLQN